MKTPYIVIGRKIVTREMTPGIEWLFGEKFVSMIFYDGSIVPGYYISNFGRIYSITYNRLLSQCRDQWGYFRVTITLPNGKTCYTGVHKLTLMSFHPIVENDIHFAHHLDGVKDHNFVGNLDWATVSENTRHALDTGLANCKCENNSRSVLTNEQVHVICKMMEDGFTNSEILDEIGYYYYGKERNKMAAIIRLIRRGQDYLDIAKQYDIPGINGIVTYPLDYAVTVCNVLTDGNDYTIEEVCDILGITLENRKMFTNYIDDLIKGNTATYITRPIKDKIKRPKALPRNPPMHDWYY